MHSGDVRYPALKADIEAADRILAPSFEEADDAAVRFQKRFYRAELSIIYGGVIAVGLGATAGFTGIDALSFMEGALTALLGSVAFVARGLKWHRNWLRRRWAAETLRGERFLFIGRLGDYAEAREPDRVLRRRLVEIERLARKPRADG